jgi:hypothetical protein
MARIKKFGDTRSEKLSTFQTFIVDDNPNSTYFRISEFKETFTGGKNGFLIEGSEFLKETTEIKVEILDVEGNPIYFEPGEGIPSYYEGVSKLVSVHIYEDTPIGIGKITILGELKNYLDSGDIIRTIPDDWKGLYNVRWERDFMINRLLSNEDKVRFNRRPVVEIDEITRPIFTATPTLVQQSGIVNGLPIVPTEGTQLANFSLPTSYLLTITNNSNWTASVVGNPVVLPNLGVQLQSSDVITNKQLAVTTPYTVNGIVQPFFNQPYTASFNYLELDSTLGTALSGSFAKINITELTTFVGDVARVKVFRKSQSEVSDFQFVQEIPLESNEILIDLESSQRNQELYGLFTPFVIQNYWVTSSNNLTTDFNQNFLYNSVKLDSVGTNRFFSVKEIPTSTGIEYTFSVNTRLEENLSANNSISIYLEGIRNGLTTRQQIVNIPSSNAILQKSNVTANFIAEELQNAKLIFEVSGNGWYISDVSLRASQESSFSPDEITFIQPVPRTLQTETFDFRFEFYDINNNFIPVRVEKTKTFDGGNLNRIAKRLELQPSSLYFQFDSGSGTGNPLPPSAIFIDVVKEFLTGSTNFTSRSFDLDNNELSASVYVGEQYPGLLIDEGDDRFRLTVQNFTGSKEDTVVQYIEYVAECEGVSDTIVITRVSDGKGGVNFEIRPFRGTVIRNKNELSTLEVQAVRIDGINEINLVSGLPLNQSDTKLFVQSGSNYLTITEASSSGFLKGVTTGTTGSSQLDYNPVFNRDSIVGQLVLYLIPSSSANRAESIVSTLTLTDILDGLDAGFVEYDIDVFTINPRTETIFTPISASVTASYYRRGTSQNPISASVIIYPSMSINQDFIPEFWLNYRTGSVNPDIVINGFNEIKTPINPVLPANFVGNPLSQSKQLTLSFNYIEPYTSESVLVDHTFNIIPEGIPGQDAIIYEVVPAGVTLRANESGIVTDFGASATEIKVKQGFDYLAFTGSKKPGTFFISSASVIGNNVTPGAVYFDNTYTQSLLVSASTEFDVVALTGSVQYLIQVHPFFTSSFFTQSLVQPYVKTLDGQAARSVTLQASSNIVNFDGNGIVISPEGDIVLTATAFGATGSVFYQFYRNDVAYSTVQSSNIFEVGSGDAALIGETTLWSVKIRDGGATSQIRAEGSVTIAGVQGGADAYNVQLTNENSSVVSSVFDVLTLSGSGTDILATKGDVALQAVTSFASPQFDQLGTEIPNGQYRVKIASKPSYITLAGGLVSGSTVPVVSGIARIGNITAWSNARTNPTAQIVYEVNLENGRRTTFKTQSLSVQFEGEIGPGLIMRGVWTGSLQYIFDTPSKRRDSVIYPGGINETYYWASLTSSLNQPPPTIVGEPSENPRDANAYWEYLGKEEFFVAAKMAIFEESFVKNTINVGNNPGSAFANIVIAGGRIDPYFAIGQNGTVGVSGNQTGSGIIGYDRPGIFMGTFDSSGNKTARFSLKNGASGTNSRSLTWDGDTLTIVGAIRQREPGIPEGSYRGAWTSGVTYYPDDTVTYNGASYINSVTHTSTNDTNINTGFPPNATNSWSVFAAAGTSGTAGTAGSGGVNGTNGTNGVNGTNGTNGSDGGPGPGVVFRGNYLLGETYFFTATRRDIVRSGSTFYLFATPTTDSGTTSHTSPPSANWTAFGAQFSSVATDILLAQDATITRGLVMGAGDGGSSFIRSSGATSLTTGTGFFMSSSGNFRFGDSNNHLEWDGSNLIIVGGIRQISPGVPEGRVLGIWNNISNGFSIFTRDIVTHNGKTWVANTSHSKGASFEPGVSAVWEIAADSGTSGTAGVSGTNGANGANGTNGVNGTNGANGTNGVNGTNGTNGPAGGPGPGVVFRGEYVSGETYFFTANRRDIVKSGGTFYLFLTATTDSGTTSHSAPPSGNWTAFGAQFSSVATDVLLAQDANITRGLVMGADATGSSFIRSSGATSLTTGTGFFMSSSGNFRFGDGVSDTGSFVSWDGAILEVGGIIKTRGGQNSELGNWVVDEQGRFRDSGSKVILDAEQRGMFIQDNAGDTKLSVRTGELASITGGTVTNTPTTINHSALVYTSNQSFTQTFTTTGFSTTLNAGQYSFSINSTSMAGSITHSSPTSGYFNISYSYQVLNASNELVASINLAAGTSTGTGGNVVGQSGLRTLSISTAGTYTIRPIYVVNAFFSIPGQVSFPSQNFTPSPATIIFSPLTNFAELTDSGLQVVSSNDRFVKLQRGGIYEIETKGQSYFQTNGLIAGQPDAIRVDGNIIPNNVITSSLGRSGFRWEQLHINEIFSPTLPTTATAANLNIDITAGPTLGRFRRTTSSERYKLNIEDLDKSLVDNSIMNLRPVWYRSNPDTTVDRPDWSYIGLIAEEVAEIEPRLVQYNITTGSNGQEVLIPGSVQYDRIGVLLLSHIQSQTKIIDELSKKVNDLELLISSSNNL